MTKTGRQPVWKCREKMKSFGTSKEFIKGNDLEWET